MPDTIVLAQADTPAEAPADASAAIAAEIEAQVRDLATEIQVPDQPSSDGWGAPAVVGAFVPIVLFIAIAAVFVVKYYLGYRARQEVQATVRSALERGVPMTGELLDRIVETPVPQRSDLRRGAIWMALGVGLGAFGLALGEEDAVRPMLATGLVPLLLGAAYLVLWRLGDRESSRGPSAERGG
jgi:hypothetical protein